MIRTHVVSSFRVVEETEDRLVLQANFLNHCGCASVIILFGSVIPFGIGGTAGVVIGALFCVAGIVGIILGLSGAGRRIIFDRPAGEVRIVAADKGQSIIPFRDIDRVEQRRQDISDTDSVSSTFYYFLYLITDDGREIEVCVSRDEELISDLKTTVRGFIQTGR